MGNLCVARYIYSENFKSQNPGYFLITFTGLMAVASVNKIDKIDCNNNLLNVKVERRECVEWIAIVDSIISGNITMPPEDLCAVAKQCESNNCSGDDVCRSVISNHSNKQRVHDDIIWQTEKMMMKNTTISLLNKTKNLAHEFWRVEISYIECYFPR